MPTGIVDNPPTGIDLYRYQNGEIVIRQPRDPQSGSGPPWTSQKVGTRIEAKARKRLAAWLKKKKIDGIDAATVPFVDHRVKANGANGEAPVLRNPTGVNQYTGLSKAERKRDYMREWSRRKKAKQDGKTAATRDDLESARALVQVVGQSLAAAATSLRLLNEALGNPSED